MEENIKSSAVVKPVNPMTELAREYLAEQPSHNGMMVMFKDDAVDLVVGFVERLYISQVSDIIRPTPPEPEVAKTPSIGQKKRRKAAVRAVKAAGTSPKNGKRKDHSAQRYRNIGYIDSADLAKIVKVDVATIHAWRKEKPAFGPQFTTDGRRVWYYKNTVKQWLLLNRRSLASRKKFSVARRKKANGAKRSQPSAVAKRVTKARSSGRSSQPSAQ